MRERVKWIFQRCCWRDLRTGELGSHLSAENPDRAPAAPANCSSLRCNEKEELGLCIDMVAVNNIIRCYRSVIQDALDLQIGKLCGTIGILVAGKHGSFVEFFDSLITKILPDPIGQIYLEEKDRDS
ncbi:hypothetical protein SELMODRAFT_404514 [Selaginella moellendorffii]|uniref:Uncharacterized protein n=1 Tax=Selaginella moellendorffii TaxID=88036 RepID=D8QVK6_SELML|nr:hypothetical protein SELMODRAFT_404514 [Selaginella moellendorffii]